MRTKRTTLQATTIVLGLLATLSAAHANCGACGVAGHAHKDTAHKHKDPTRKELKKKAGEQMQSARQLVGADLYGKNGEELGEIEEVVLTRDRKDIDYVVLASGGFLGIGEKDVALPLVLIQPHDQQGSTRLKAGLTEAMVKDAPEFKAKDAEAEQRLIKETRGFLKNNTDGLDWEADTSTAETGMEAWKQRTLDELTGSPVRGAGNETVGELEAAVIDLKNNKIAYAVIDGGGTYDGKVVIVPWESLRFPAKGKVAVDADRSKLDATAFDDDKVPFLGDLRLGAHIYGRHGVAPYWAPEDTDAAWHGGWHYGYWPYVGVPGTYYY